ncbi:MAG TPA: DUF1841 family protein [Usitatibacter sp.]|nr:DUF1841 family protein [Usitatibacter sp.]
MFNPSRDEARDFLFSLWAKHRAGVALTALESLALSVILEHPEYHPVLDDRDRNLDREWRPEGGETNPFLHLSMHLAIEEQVSIDQPPGIRAAVAALERRTGSAHDARHAVMECLAEIVWQAQRNGVAFDNAAYLGCLGRKSGAQPR